MRNVKKLSAAVLATLAMGTAYAATDAEMEAFLNPYGKGFPTAPGVTAGVVIDKGNVDQFKDVLAPRVYDLVKAGNTSITVGRQLSNPAQAGYVAASKKTAAKVKVQFGQGKIEGYEGGMPFPYEPSTSDPNAAEKLAWNNRYSLEVPDDINIDPFVWEYRDANTGKINRTVTFGPGALSNTGHRTINGPENLPGSDEFYSMINLAVKAPQDLKDTAVLFKRSIDSSKDDDGQLYLGFQRRARRLSTAATTDPFLGSNIMIEEFRGFNGKVNDFTWKYLGTKNILLPYYKHGEGKLRDEYKTADWNYTAYAGKGNCWAQAPWSLRKVYIVEMTPKRADHPISRRTLYFDAESFHGTISEVYDRKGEFWKLWTLGIGHSSGQLPAAAKKGRWTWDTASMIDVQSNQCTTLNFRVSLEPVPPSVYTIEYIRSRQ